MLHQVNYETQSYRVAMHIGYISCAVELNYLQ